MPRRHLATTLLLALALAAAGCGGDDDQPAPAQGSAAPAATDEQLNLKGACPDTVIIQTDWDPEAEHGVYYHLLGPNPEVDTERKRVSGPLVAQGKDTGVRLEVRTGGPSIGFEPVSAQMYKDKDITLGQVSTDEAIRFSDGQPTQAVVAPMEVSPFMIMWDPATYPQFQRIADIGKTDTKVFYFEGDTYMEYLIAAGVLQRAQVDGSYDGKPANFVAAGGKAAQAGFATSEPYIYEKEIRQWAKPVRYALVNEAGYPFYPQALSMRAADRRAARPLPGEAGPDRAAGPDRLPGRPGRHQRADRRAWSSSTTPAGCTRPAWPTTPSPRCARPSSATGPTRPWATSTWPGSGACSRSSPRSSPPSASRPRRG